MATSKKTRYRVEKGMVHIDLNLKHISQLFDSRDPSPFLERDLDDNAVDYIVSAANEHAFRTPVGLTIHLSEETLLDTKTVVDAVHNHFAYDSELAQKKLRKIFRQGQMALILGLTILFSCLTLSKSIPVEYSIPKEGLTILGWVAMWRPINDFLYSWWPQFEMVRVFRKLSQVPIDIRLGKKS